MTSLRRNKYLMQNNVINRIKPDTVTITISLLFAFFCAIGFCFNAYGEEIGHISPIKLIIYMLLNLIWIFPATCLTINSKRSVCDKNNHLEKTAFITTLCSCLIYAAIWYPGNMSYDALFQIEQYLGNYPLTNHHPVFVTIGFGLLFSLGSKINEEFGVFLIILTNIALWAGAVTFTMHKLCKWKIRKNICLAVLLFYTFFPIIMIYVVTATKDSWFFPLILMFFAEYLDKYEDEEIEIKDCGLMLALCAVSCFVRHGTVLILFPAIIAFAIKHRKGKIMMACLAAMILTVTGLAAIEKAYPKDSYDQYSTLFQLTARHLILYADDVTDEEYRIINTVLDAEEIKEVYNPHLSDDVKNTANTKAPSDAEIKAYLKCWIKMFIRHPAGYIEGFLNGCYGYLDPLTCSFGHYDKNQDFFGTTCEMYIKNELHEGDDAPERHIERHSTCEPLRIVIGLTVVPIVYSRLGATGIWTWIIILSFGILWRKKRYDLMPVCLMPFLQVGLCMLSPVNTNLRYALPQMVFSPILMIWCMTKTPYKPTNTQITEGEEK